MIAEHDLQAIRGSRGKLVRVLTEAGAELRGNACKCVLHDDTNPSAAVYQADDGTWRYKCHGCGVNADVIDLHQRLRGGDFRQAVEALGGDTIKAPSTPAKNNGSAKAPRVYPTVQDAAESFARWKQGTVETIYRWDDDWHRARIKIGDAKTFCEVTRNGTGWKLKGPAKPHRLYRIDEVPDDGTVYIQEGEKAVDAGWSIGLPSVTSGGSSSARAADWAPLAGRDVVILPDNDGPGEKYAGDVVKTLLALSPPARVRIVRLPGRPESGDLVDLLAGCADDDDRQGLRQQVEILAEQADLEIAEVTYAEAPARPEAPPPAEQAHGVEAPAILDPADPLPAAREFVTRCYHSKEEQRNTLIRHMGDFYRYEGSHYTTLADESVKASLYSFLEASYGWHDKALVPYQPTKTRVANLIDALAALVHVNENMRPPCWLSPEAGDPDPRDLIAFDNCLLSVRTREKYPLTARFFCQYALSLAYDASATQPPAEWLRFLASLWPDDPQSIDALCEWFGYVLAGDTRQHKMMLLVGPKRGGKGTIGRILRALLGEHNVCAPTLAGLQTNFGLAALIGKPLAIIGDARLSGRADQQAVVERLLSISGEDAITIPRKFRDDVTLQLPTRFMLMSNELPRLSDSSGALASRFVVLTLSQSWLGREDTALLDRLLTELPQILHWALEGWRRLQARGRFVQPESAAEAIGDLEDLASPISAFLRDRCTLDDAAEVAADDLFNAWAGWCREQGRDHPGTKQTFGRDLRAAVPRLRIVQHRLCGPPLRFYGGIGLEWASEAQ